MGIGRWFYYFKCEISFRMCPQFNTKEQQYRYVNIGADYAKGCHYLHQYSLKLCGVTGTIRLIWAPCIVPHANPNTHTALVRCIHSIRVTSHEGLNVSNHRRLDCLFNSLSTRPDLHATIPDLHATIPDLHATRPDLRATNRTNGECTSRPNNDEGTLWSEPAYCNSIF